MYDDYTQAIYYYIHTDTPIRCTSKYRWYSNWQAYLWLTCPRIKYEFVHPAESFIFRVARHNSLLIGIVCCHYFSCKYAVVLTMVNMMPFAATHEPGVEFRLDSQGLNTDHIEEMNQVLARSFAFIINNLAVVCMNIAHLSLVLLSVLQDNCDEDYVSIQTGLDLDKWLTHIQIQYTYVQTSSSMMQ